MSLQSDKRAYEAARELARRKTEALKLYRPMPVQEQFHRSLASERILRGGNRSGKSLSSFAETAHAATGLPLYDALGREIPDKYPRHQPLQIWVVGYDQAHIGSVIYRLLFQEGAFKCIKDLKTGELRAFNPGSASDKARESECVPSEPFIPPRLYDEKDWAWESKGDRVFSVARLKNGTEIRAFSSKGAAAQGSTIDLIHIDEDICYPQHVPEWQARLPDRKGRLVWSAFPHSANQALMLMSERAEEQKDLDKPDIEEFVLTFSANKHIDEEQKRKRIAAWEASSPEERKARDLGEFRTDSVRIYPNFSKLLHGMPAKPESMRVPDKIEQILEARGGVPPNEWTRYLALDPGHAVCAVILAAVPPPSLGDHLIIFDELYLRKLSADQVAKAVARKTANHNWHEFIIDSRAARQTPMGHAETVGDTYSKAFKRHGVRSIATGSRFIPGSDNVQSGIALVRENLTIRQDGSTRLRVWLPTTYNLQKEFNLYKKRITANEVTDTPIDQNNHLMDALRYLVCRKPVYQAPRRSPHQKSPAERCMDQIKQLFQKSDPGPDNVFLGAGDIGSHFH